MAGEDVHVAQSEEEEDIEPLSAKMDRLRKEAAGKRAMGSSSAGRTRRKATVGRPVVGHTPRVLMQGRKNSRRRSPSRIPLYSY
jgi:hypothetical protein